VFKELHSELEDSLNNDSGISLMYKDSNIIEQVLLKLKEENILGVPLHDSIICRQSDKDRVKESSKAVLKTINSELAKDIDNYFSIDIKEYGADINTSEPRAINKEEKDKIYRHKFGKFLLALGTAFMFYIIGFPESINPVHMQNSYPAFGYLGLFGIVIIYILLVGQEQSEEGELETRLKYNITIDPAPSKDEYITSLETKIDQLTYEKKLKLN
jgi:hypothetical protein